jgi:hypothetical protein
VGKQEDGHVVLNDNELNWWGYRMARAHVCRYCHESFVPKAGKPGYIDECPLCLHEKTHPELPPDAYSSLMKLSEFRDAIKSFRRALKLNGIEGEEAERRIERLAELAYNARYPDAQI